MAPTIGDHIAARRRAAALTQEVLAERAGISVEVIRKLEQGTKSSARVSTLRALAQALGTTTSSLLGDASTGAARREPDHDQVALLDLRRVLTPARGLGGRPSTPGPGGAAPVDLAAFRGAIGVVDRAYHDDDYATTLAALPGLLIDGRTVAATAPTGDRSLALSLLSAAYRVTGTTLIQLRSFDLAYQALDLGMDAADEAGDEVAGASTVVTLCWLLLRQGRLAEVEHLAVQTADRIEPSFTRLDAPRMAVWGWLLLRAAAAAARDNRIDDAAGMLDAAAAAAVRIGANAGGRPAGDPVSIGAFDTATVAMKRVEAAVVAGDAASALQLAHHVPPTGRPTSNNRNRFRLDVAHAQAMHGSYTAAVETLRAIRADAPTWLRQQRYATDVVSVLATARRRAVSAELAELAGFVDARI